jgi:hypothetical protein
MQHTVQQKEDAQRQQNKGDAEPKQLTIKKLIKPPKEPKLINKDIQNHHKLTKERS